MCREVSKEDNSLEDNSLEDYSLENNSLEDNSLENDSEKIKGFGSFTNSKAFILIPK